MSKGFCLTVAICLALLLGLGLAAPQHARCDAKITLTYANFPPSTTFPCVQMERWAKEVEKRTNGRVKMQTFPGGTLLPAKNIFDGVITGTADIGNFAMSYQPGRFPVSEAVDLPIGFSSARNASLALYDLIEKYPKEFEKVKLLTRLHLPSGRLHDDQARALAERPERDGACRVGYGRRGGQEARRHTRSHAPVGEARGAPEGRR